MNNRRTHYIRIKTIRQELNVFNIIDKTVEYQRNCFYRAERRNQSRLAKRSYHYAPKGRGRGRLYEGWRDQFCFEPCDQNSPVRQ